jgi:type II secretory pathway component GspD/PulD (secretin)
MGMMLGGLGGDSGSDASGGTFTASGTVSIVADPRLNALVVQANEEDLMMIDDLLTVIDQEDSQTDVQLQGKPRLIPIVYTDADNIANVLKEVYADRIIGNNRGQQQQRQPSPEDIIKALRGGGGGGRGGGGNESRGEVTKMTIGVDTTSNSVIVAAPDQLFKEVEDLVKTIDQAGTQTNETLEVRTLHLANPDVVREALSSILGEEVNSSSSGGSSSSSRSSSSGGQSGQATADQIRQRMEFFNRLRSSGAFGSQGGSSGGRPSGFPGSSGGRPGGSPGGAPGGGRPGGGGR